jgi:hypothetical protein
MGAPCIFTFQTRDLSRRRLRPPTLTLGRRLTSAFLTNNEQRKQIDIAGSGSNTELTQVYLVGLLFNLRCPDNSHNVYNEGPLLPGALPIPSKLSSPKVYLRSSKGRCRYSSPYEKR